MRRGGFTMMVLFFGVIGMLYVWMRIDLLRVSSDIERLKEQEVVLENRREVLQLQLSQLTAPQKIAQAARRELDLEMPEQGQIVLVAPETAVATNDSQGRKSVQLARRPIIDD